MNAIKKHNGLSEVGERAESLKISKKQITGILQIKVYTTI